MEHAKPEKKMCRFIDTQYHDLFYIPDGGKIEVSYQNGNKRTFTCKHMDDYHTEIGGIHFHICQFAESMKKVGATVQPAPKPKRRSNKQKDTDPATQARQSSSTRTVAPATIESLTELLHTRMQAEYDTLLAELKALPSEAVIERCYEKVLKEDLLLCVETGEFSKKQLEGLLSLDEPLATAYGEWLSNDCSHMELLQDTLETLANAEAKHLRPKEKQAER